MTPRNLNDDSKLDVSASTTVNPENPQLVTSPDQMFPADTVDAIIELEEGVLAETLNSAKGAVLVTGVGGAAGIATVEALRSVGEKVVGVDCDSWAAGFALCDVAVTVPKASDPVYGEVLRSIISQHDVDVIVPTTVEEMPDLHTAIRNGGLLTATTIVPSPEALQACVDKAQFSRVLIEREVPTVPCVPVSDDSDNEHARTMLMSTLNFDENDFRGWVVKPRTGRGSRGVSFHPMLFEAFRQAHLDGVDDTVVQPKLTGREFTCDTYTASTGASFVSARWRVATKAGISTMGETFTNVKVTSAVEGALAAVGLVGPGCVQGFLTDAGNVYIVEINPRFGGGLPLTVHAGANLPKVYVDVARGLADDTATVERLTVIPGMKMSRYLAPVFQMVNPLMSEESDGLLLEPSAEGWYKP